MINTLEEYRKQFDTYDGDRFTFIRQTAKEGKKIIDIGCCYGFVFKDYDHTNIISVDLDDYSHIVPNFVRCSALSLPFENDSFEIGVLGEILEHQTEPEKVLKEACRVAKKIVLTVPNEYLWKEGTDSFHRYKDVVRENNNDMTQMALKHAPLAQDRYTEDGYAHIFHQQHFSPYDIVGLIEKSTDRSYYIYILPNDGDTKSGACGTTASIIE